MRGQTYSLLVKMCGLNKTAMLQVRAHAISDQTKNLNNLWEMIENRFTEERLNKVQGYLNEIGAFKNESNEGNKVLLTVSENWLMTFAQLMKPKYPLTST